MSLSTQKQILIVANGDSLKTSEIELWTQEKPFIIATDGALRQFKNSAIKPNLLVGDFDSIDPLEMKSFEGTVQKLPDQESTDFQKAISIAHSLSPEKLVVLGAEGSRLDHTISALHFASRFASRTNVRFALNASIVHIISGDWSGRANVGGHFSVIPMPEISFLSSTGLEWPLAGLTLAVGARDGVSNLSISSQIELKVKAGSAAVFVERYYGDAIW